MAQVSSGVVAGCFSLAAFAIAIIAGLAAQNPASTILLRALGILVICWPIGYAAGALCRRVIEEDDAAAAATAPDAPPPQAESPGSDSSSVPPSEPASVPPEPATR